MKNKIKLLSYFLLAMLTACNSVQIDNEALTCELTKQLTRYNAAYGAVLVVDIKTGEEVSSLQLVNTDNNSCEKCDSILNKPITPGSLWLPVTMSLLLEGNCMNVYDTINTNIELYNLKDVCDPGSINMIQAIAIGSNVFFAEAMRQCYTGNNTEYHNDMNINIQTMYNVKFESDSSIPKLWFSIGYGVAVTPEEILNIYVTIAKGGENINNKQILRKETAQDVHQALIEVVQNGTGRYLKSLDCSIVGKTGFAQLRKKKFNSSFAGYFPANNPLYACFFLLGESEKNIYSRDWTLELMEIVTDIN